MVPCTACPPDADGNPVLMAVVDPVRPRRASFPPRPSDAKSDAKPTDETSDSVG